MDDLKHRWMRYAAVCVAASLTLAATAAAPSARAAVSQDDGIGTPRFTVEPLNATLQPNATTIPYWSSSFTYHGTTYPFTMVGTNPGAGSATSTIPTEIIPLNFVFSNGVALDGTTKVAQTVNSPIFQSAGFKSGTTQYGDAIQRANFWNAISTTSPNWHVLYGQPQVLETRTIDVPANQGVEFTGSHSGKPIGLISISWFAAHLQNLLGSMQIDPRTMPIFLTYNTFLYISNVNNCCVLGFHGAGIFPGRSVGPGNGNGAQPINTYIYAAYNDPGIFATSTPLADITALSHETAEWLNDPFTPNIVPAWSVPSEPQYGCSDLLKVGDPLVGTDFNVSLNGMTYHPQDEAFLPWFSRTSPSTSLNGLYTYLGTFTTYSPCVGGQRW